MTSSVRTRSSHYGNVQQLPSGRWRARYVSPDGKRRSKTFDTKTDARVFLATTQADQVRKVWRAPSKAKTTVGTYAAGYLARTDLRPSTRSLYEQVWRTHLKEDWQDAPVTEATPVAVREWYTAKQKGHTKPTALAQAYRLLRAIFNVAVHDQVIDTNPCRIRAASTAKRARATKALTVGEVMQVAASPKIPDRQKALLLVLAFGALRYGEATALRRQDVTEDGSTIQVSRSQRNGVVGPPKTESGIRSVALPQAVAAVLRTHLADHTDPSPDALLFGTSTGGFMARQNWAKILKRALEDCGLPEIRTHELRHTGATLAAQSGATTKELMSRLGHASPNAALVYQHAASERDVAIAEALDRAIVGG